MNVTIIGIGLIGGSLALDIKNHFPNAEFLGIDANENNLLEAEKLLIIEGATTYEDLKFSDFVILATPVDVSVNIITEIMNNISDQTIVFDVGSTKLPICKAIENHSKRRNFMACHPIAGTEFSGPSASIVGLFENKTMIVCEVEKTTFKLQEKAMELFRKIGMRIRYMDPKSHDKHIAYVSHLSHISSFMLGKTVVEKEKDEQDIFDMAGSGFESTVRLAKSSPAMWTPIFKQNKKHVLKSLEEYISNLTKFKTLLENDDYKELFNEMEKTNRIKEILK